MPTFISPGMKKYLTSDKRWKSRTKGDSLLHRVVWRSLDMTIDELERETFIVKLNEFKRMKRIVEEQCVGGVVFPCDASGKRNKQNICIWIDVGIRASMSLHLNWIIYRRIIMDIFMWIYKVKSILLPGNKAATARQILIDFGDKTIFQNVHGRSNERSHGVFEFWNVLFLSVDLRHRRNVWTELLYSRQKIRCNIETFVFCFKITKLKKNNREGRGWHYASSTGVVPSDWTMSYEDPIFEHASNNILARACELYFNYFKK